MPKSKKQQRLRSQRRRRQDPIPLPLVPPPRTLWKVLARWRRCLVAIVVVVSALGGLIIFVDWAFDQYSVSFPDVRVTDMANLLDFKVKNQSHFFYMQNVMISCNLRSRTFESGFGGTITIDSGDIGGTSALHAIAEIEPDQEVSFPCDPKIGPLEVYGRRMRLLELEICIEVKYKTVRAFFSWSSNYTSPIFYCDETSIGTRCHSKRVEVPTPPPDFP